MNNLKYIPVFYKCIAKLIVNNWQQSSFLLLNEGEQNQNRFTPAFSMLNKKLFSEKVTKVILSMLVIVLLLGISAVNAQDTLLVI